MDVAVGKCDTPGRPHTDLLDSNWALECNRNVFCNIDNLRKRFCYQHLAPVPPAQSPFEQDASKGPRFQQPIPVLQPGNYKSWKCHWRQSGLAASCPSILWVGFKAWSLTIRKGIPLTLRLWTVGGYCRTQWKPAVTESGVRQSPHMQSGGGGGRNLTQNPGGVRLQPYLQSHPAIINYYYYWGTLTGALCS